MPNSHRLRLGRHSEPGRIYLLTACTHDRRPFFAEAKAGRQLVRELRAAQEQGWVGSLAWVIMPDHFHWLIQLHKQELSLLMKQVKANSSRRLRMPGRIWQTGFHDRALRKEDDLLAVARYIVANPLRAGLVTRLGDYPLWDAVWL